MRKRISLGGGVLWAAAFAVLCLPASGAMLEFSGELSDNDAPVNYFNARIVYDYDSSAGELSLTIHNDTINPPSAYAIAEVFFNVSDDVAGLTLQSNPAFTEAALTAYDSSSPSLTQAGGFGDFDWMLDLAGGNAGLAAQASTTFVLDVSGTGLSTADFFSGVSWDNGDLNAAVGAIKFTQGTDNDDSVYATPVIVPEPASVLLLGLGAAGLLVLRRRK